MKQIWYIWMNEGMYHTSIVRSIWGMNMIYFHSDLRIHIILPGSSNLPARAIQQVYFAPKVQNTFLKERLSAAAGHKSKTTKVPS